MLFRYQYDLNEETRKMYITGLPFETKYVEVPREKRFERLYSYNLIKIDLLSAISYLDISLQTTDMTIKEGMFRIALILYIKCFNNSGVGRSQLSVNKVYKDTQGEPIECHKKLKRIRDKYIAHDEIDFLNAKLGMVLNENEKCIMGIAYPEMQAKFDYDETLIILQSLCKIALERTNLYLEEETHKVENYLRQRDYEIVSEYSEMTIEINEI
ncbi:hypothetical protein [Paenibacillus riograndensis]|uniref:HEPN AbiU2-like domain-containing protein n=2 Tax=Paenibacillus riograndensis TaxID=483937 RepID=A0A0E4H863_9BACL|nr:hypothetical protein [Paenibacillus riograndensis]CQR52533.1 hypothetical protein PRIO_0872 [Paenibacillus riograndensis SBR5]